MIHRMMQILFGAVLGTALTLGLSFVQRIWQKQDAAAQEKAVRAKEVRERADLKAEELLVHLQSLEAALSPSVDPRIARYPGEQSSIDDLLILIRAGSIYFPDPIRMHLRILLIAVPLLDEAAELALVNTPPRRLATRLGDRCQTAIGEHLRGEDVATPDEMQVEVLAAAEAVLDAREPEAAYVPTRRRARTVRVRRSRTPLNG